MIVKKASTDITTYVKLIDSTAGTPETGLTVTDLDLTYLRRGAAPAAKVDVTALAATDSVHADNKAIEVDGTNMPGLYRVDWPDAAFATGVNSVILCVNATGVDPAFLEVELVDYDPTDSVRMGITALPNAAAEAAGGLHTIGTGAGQFAVDGSGAITTVATTTTNTDMISSATVNAACDSAIETYGLDHLVSASVTGTDVADNSIIAYMVSKATPNADWDGFSSLTDSLEALRDQGDAAWTTATSVTVSDKTGFTLAADQSTVTIGTVTTNTDMRGTDSAFLAANAPANFADMAITASTGLVDVNGKTGFSLASAGLDSVSTTAPSGVAGNYREMMVAVWRALFKKSTLTATELKTYADNGSSVLTTQAVSDDGTTQTQGAAS